MANMLIVKTKTRLWEIPVNKIKDIRLLSSAYECTEETYYNLPIIEDMYFQKVYNFLVKEEDIDWTLEDIVPLIKVCDYLDFERLLNVLCLQLAEKLETMSEEEYQYIHDQWKKS